MLLMPNKKKIATLIVSGGKTPDFVQKMGEKSSLETEFKLPEDEEDEESSMGLSASAEAIIKAIGSGDASSLMSALKDFIEMCSYSKKED